MNPIGIMQGRLSPPLGDRIQAFPAATWRQEFEAARQAGLDCIEWIYEPAPHDPLATEAGRAEIRALAARHRVAVSSVCADRFMTDHLLTADGAPREAAVERLRGLLTAAGAIGAAHVVLPFVDASRISNQAQRSGLEALLRRLVPDAARSGVELHLETDLPPSELGAVLDRVGSPWVRANLDTGNSAALGWPPADELAALGERVGSVHLKDRLRGGGTVPLGTGDSDLPAYLSLLARAGYDRPYILQVARGEDGQEGAWAVANREHVARILAAGLPGATAR